MDFIGGLLRSEPAARRIRSSHPLHLPLPRRRNGRRGGPSIRPAFAVVSGVLLALVAVGRVSAWIAFVIVLVVCGTALGLELTVLGTSGIRD